MAKAATTAALGKVPGAGAVFWGKEGVQGEGEGRTHRRRV